MDKDTKLRAEKELTKKLNASKGKLRGVPRRGEERSFVLISSFLFGGELGAKWFDIHDSAVSFIDGFRQAEEHFLIASKADKLESGQSYSTADLIKDDMNTIYLVDMKSRLAWVSDIDGFTLLSIEPDAILSLHE